ncbi:PLASMODESMATA CALLOSE-BINDING PROTEIN 5 isoform X2 [Lathyrus oleraceus]|uniref:X8 domain-containing protein n=1 Tax=Pisum sativum TaxID=3888 RepID=A0A9D4VPD6_PEA|nr:PLASMODESMATA CALLOSE-BINDING PROTEIN 5-like isoform X2 [Pisum sativum]KAI5387704.1 hypothetical protein KIW84_073699 [Pisum sativum]
MPTRETFIFSWHFPLFLLLILSPFCGGSGGGDATKQELWCVAKNNAEDAALQSALDWACGAGGADCRPIQNGGPCYDVNSVQNTASFAFNDYFLKNGLTDDSCNFSNNAAVTSLDPSHDKCKFPSGLAVINGSSTESTPSHSTGLGPSGNVSGCSKASWRWWFWLSGTTHLLLMVSLYA